MVEAIVDIPLPGMIQAGSQAARPLLDQRAGGPRSQRCHEAESAVRHFLAGPKIGWSRWSFDPYSKGNRNGYNPIVLYGPSGTGKSHLAQGVAVEWKARNRRRVECIARGFRQGIGRGHRDAGRRGVPHEISAGGNVGFRGYRTFGKSQVGKTERPKTSLSMPWMH